MCIYKILTKVKNKSKVRKLHLEKVISWWIKYVDLLKRFLTEREKKKSTILQKGIIKLSYFILEMQLFL